ncbi:MAG: O-antigen ligase family protein [Nitrosomonas sp.]|nr:O-antigen ligase family protein [Nitrosomonas sp.]
MQISITWRELLIRFALVFICLGFWYTGLSLFYFPLLGIAWLIDGGLRRLKQDIKEPLIQAILLLCTLLLIGLLWSELPEDGRMKWMKYFMLLIFIPFYSLLNKERLPWAIGGLLTGYLGVLALGIYQWLVMGVQGIPLLGMSYLSFSAMLGVGVVVAAGFACLNPSIKLRISLCIVALALLFAQFYQGGRIFLVATLITVLFLAFLRYKMEFRKFMGILLSVLSIAVVFAYNSPVFQDRWAQAKNDIELLQQGNYSSSLGYRLAIWDVGLHGISERPLLGYGTGTPESYFENTILTYKNGIYKNLPEFEETAHYHNDWIEIAMHIGIPGILALLFLLWSWYQIFSKNQLGILGVGLVSYIFLAGLTETFMIFSRTSVMLLMITAIAVNWQSGRH